MVPIFFLWSVICRLIHDLLQVQIDLQVDLNFLGTWPIGVDQTVIWFKQFPISSSKGDKPTGLDLNHL